MSRNDDIKRQLGHGMGTARQKLREYYDPFEPRPPKPAEEPQGSIIDFDLSGIVLQVEKK